MERPDDVTLGSIGHPSKTVDRIGFPLDHPYVEQCLLPLLGPTSVLLLRRLPVLWKESDPVRTSVDELAGVLGVRSNQMARTLDRIVRFGFAKRPAPDRLEVFSRCAPLPHRILDRQPGATRDAHHRLVAEHLDQLAHHAVDRVAAGAAPSREPRLHIVPPSLPDLGR